MNLVLGVCIETFLDVFDFDPCQSNILYMKLETSFINFLKYNSPHKTVVHDIKYKSQLLFDTFYVMYI
jgi:hypothetical protein